MIFMNWKQQSHTVHIFVENPPIEFPKPLLIQGNQYALVDIHPCLFALNSCVQLH